MPAGELSFVVHGVPKFKVGEEYVVFLAGVSSAGFSSPIGLSQGKFTVLKSDAGTKVTNGRDFGEMTKRVVSQGSGTAVAPPNQLALEEFKRLARTRVSNSQ